MCAQIEASRRKTEFSKEVYENISRFNWKNFTDQNLTRQLSSLTDLGVSVLPVDQVLQVRDQPWVRFTKYLTIVLR